ncbi:hypothetical protein [Amycolatopsis sp. lyj-23]|uniref:hypothetical protein n=1 Tax=Amycolatopsis sp. lyj-23 TaxID=2789283 RepID=UPI00397C657D
MSTLRRLAVAGAFALPLSLVIAGPATAHPFGGPQGTWNAESSATWAGIGGAGTTDTDEGGTWWGNHHWSESESAVAGIGGAYVTHNGESGDDGWNPAWHHTVHGTWHDQDNGDCDDYDGNGYHSGDYDDSPAVSHHYVVSHPDPVNQEPAGYVVHPVYSTDHDNADNVGYYAETHSAGADGATTGHVISHAGEHHAVYDAEKLSAGPYGASSEGAHALAVPDHAAYHAWYTAAGVSGAAAHSVTAVADTTDDDNVWAEHHAGDDYAYDRG